jgi:hypothetical protein
MNQITALSALAFAVIAACGANHNKPSGTGPTGPQTPSSPIASSGHDSKAPDSVSVQADGTITSGGGYIYGYETNPWFLGNVDTVKYCIDMDEDHFGISRAKAEESIERAVALWKKSFKGATFENHREEPAGTLVIGTQDFEQVSCDEGPVDIRFQLGKLTTEQRKIIKNPRQYVGVTVQEQYDEEQMRGRGFIYIAPETGDLRPDADDLANNFWRYDDQILLDSVLLHELGHVFGLSHDSSSFPMAATFCEDMVTNGSIANMENFKTDSLLKAMVNFDSIQSFIESLMVDLFSSRRSHAWVSLYGFDKYFGLDPIDLTKETTVLFEFVSDDLKLSTWNFKMDGDRLSEIKKVRNLDLKFEIKNTDRSMEEALKVRVPKKQKIMKIPQDRFDEGTSLTSSYSSLNLVSLETQRTTGYLINQKGEKTFVSLERRPTWNENNFMSMTVSIVSNNEIIELTNN